MSALLPNADDDTWVNMPLVQTLLGHYNETLPFALGLVLHTAPPPQGNDGFVLSWLGGGSGIFMSQVRPCVADCPNCAWTTAHMPCSHTGSMQALPSSVPHSGDGRAFWVEHALPCRKGLRLRWHTWPQGAHVNKHAQSAAPATADRVASESAACAGGLPRRGAGVVRRAVSL